MQQSVLMVEDFIKRDEDIGLHTHARQRIKRRDKRKERRSLKDFAKKQQQEEY